MVLAAREQVSDIADLENQLSNFYPIIQNIPSQLDSIEKDQELLEKSLNDIEQDQEQMKDFLETFTQKISAMCNERE